MQQASYPPGVTGNEPMLTGPQYEATEVRECEHCTTLRLQAAEQAAAQARAVAQYLAGILDAGVSSVLQASRNPETEASAFILELNALIEFTSETRQATKIAEMLEAIANDDDLQEPMVTEHEVVVWQGGDGAAVCEECGTESSILRSES